jgi:mechanosensitive ion channel-like protein
MERVDTLLDPLRALLLPLAAFLPRLGLALLVLAAGYLLAKAARFAVDKGLRALNLHVVTRRSGMDTFLQEAASGMDTVGLLSILVFWAVILAALIVAFNSLGLEQVTQLLGQLMLFVPRVVVGLLIIAFGTYFARFAGQAVGAYCRHREIGDGEALDRLVRYAIVVFVLVIAIDQLDIGGPIVRATFLILLGGAVLALALAFGVGGKDWAAARLEEWWPSRDQIPPPP